MPRSSSGRCTPASAAEFPASSQPDGTLRAGSCATTTSAELALRLQDLTNDGTYLRGAQTTDAYGIAQFTTVFPGWYISRTTYIHLEVHIDKKTVLTTQLFFDEALLDDVYATAPYSDHTGRENNVNNSTDSIYDDAGLLTVAEQFVSP